MNNAINKISIPDWWAEILGRINLPYGADGHLTVSTPFDSDYTTMENFWDDLEEELGLNIHNWAEDTLNDDEYRLWNGIHSHTNFILAYLNGYSRPLFEVYETSYNSVI